MTVLTQCAFRLSVAIGRALAVMLCTATFAAPLLTSPSPISAQATRADSASVLIGVAERFQAQGQTDVAEAILRLLADSYANTPAGARALGMLATLPARNQGLSGRTELKVWTTTYGLWLGVAVPAAFGAEGSEPYGAGLLVGGPTGFLAGSRIASSRTISTGQARAITLGGTWGTWQGWGWSEVADIGEEEFCDPGGNCFESGDDIQERFAAAILGGLTGIAVGTLLSKRTITPGVATTVNFGSLWGTWFGVAGGVVAGLENDALLATTLLAGNAGLLYTALRAPSWRVTRNRARIVSIAGVIGGLGGAGIDLLIQPDDEKVAFAIALGGSVVGLVTGVMVTRDIGEDLDDRPDASYAQSLVNLEGGVLSWGVPAALPLLQGINGRGGREWGVYIPLVTGRF